VLVQLGMRYEGLEYPITDDLFLHASEVGPVCDEVHVGEKGIRGISITTGPREGEIRLKKSIQSRGAAFLVEPRGISVKSLICFYVPDEANEEVGSRVDELRVLQGSRQCDSRYVTVDLVVGGDMSMCTANAQPKAILCERFIVVLLGQLFDEVPKCGLKT